MGNELDALLDEAEGHWADGQVEEALAILAQLGAEPRAQVLATVFLVELGELGQAAKALEQARAGLEEDDFELRWADGFLSLHRWESGHARRIFESLLDEADGADLRFWLSVAADLEGDFEAGDRHLSAYRREVIPEAAALVRLDADSVQTEIRAVIEGLPAAVRQALETTAVIVDPMPEADLGLATPSGAHGPDLLGLFAGPSDLEIDSGASPDPRRIYLFQRNLEREARDRAELREQVRVTLLHELGHVLGFDEDGVDELGLG